MKAGQSNDDILADVVSGRWGNYEAGLMI